MLALRLAGGLAKGSIGTSAPFELGGVGSLDVFSLLPGAVTTSANELRGYEPGALADLSTAERVAFVGRLQNATEPLGRHVVMPSLAAGGSRAAALSSDAFRVLYNEWIVPRPPVGAGRRARNVGFLAQRPEPRQIETPLSVSE